MQEVPPITLHAPDSQEQLEEECQQVSAQVQTWLDEEWTSLPVHSDLGQKAAQVAPMLHTLLHHTHNVTHDKLLFEGMNMFLGYTGI